MPEEKLQSRKGIWSWGLYDWANSAFLTLILTFVYGTYFSQSIASDPVSGATQWSYAISIAGLFLLVLGPFCGAIADHTGRLKIWIFISGLICLIGTAFMIAGIPHAPHSIIMLVLFGLVLGNIGIELGSVFYNALLPSVAKKEELGRVSSFGWSLGYAGGLVSLVLMLILFIGVNGIGPYIPLPKEQAWHIRVAIPFVILWFTVFVIPLFLFVPDRPRSNLNTKQALVAGWISLKKGLSDIRAHAEWRNFLIGSALYRDGLNTLFALGGIYAAQKYNLKTSDILLFGIGMNVTAGLGAYLVSFFEDKIGSFHVVKLSLAGLIVAGMAIFFSTTKIEFFTFALILGIFVGPVQSASRTIVSRISHDEVITENYGLYALTGRAAAFLGPFFYGLATDIFQSQNAGIISIILFWVVGFAFIYKLKDA